MLDSKETGRNDLPGPNPPALVGDDHYASTKRISTPAGDRLQTILESGRRPSHKSSRHSFRRGSVPVGFTDPEESGAEQPYTIIWSDAGLAAKEAHSQHRYWRRPQWLTRRGGWKRLLLTVVVGILLTIGLVVGLVLGLRNRQSSSNTPSQEETPSTSTPAITRTIGVTGSMPTRTATVAPTAVPASFPLGEYSIVTFLNSVDTSCTSNPSTWRCFPYTLYSDDHKAAMTTFNWNITNGSSADSYRISSTTNPFQATFNNVELSLTDEGKDTEHYLFQFLLDKEVRPTAALTSDNSATVCYYNSTTFQAFLYTKEAQSYPDGNISGTTASYPLWPFAVRVEEVIEGGDGVPNCYKVVNGQKGDPVDTSSLRPQSASSLCDCLYLNYT